jgi:hypothetical protein
VSENFGKNRANGGRPRRIHEYCLLSAVWNRRSPWSRWRGSRFGAVSRLAHRIVRGPSGIWIVATLSIEGNVPALWLSAFVVLGFILFPQAVASFLADWLPGSSASATPHLVELSGLDVLKDEFNRASGETRIIVLLSPT